MSDWLNKLVGQYFDFLKDKTEIISNTGSEWSVISTPFLGAFNDALEVYVKRNDDKILMSDDGLTIRNLELSGSSFSRSPRRKEFLEKILINYGIYQKDDEFVTEATFQTFAQKKHNFISAISEINDMYLLSKPVVSSVFKEDVQLYLDEQEIIYTPQFISKGTTGLEFTFDFQIAYSKKEIVIKAFNNINKANLPAFLFTWSDIKAVREKITKKSIVGLALINNQDKEIQSDFLEALKSQNADFILWSDRHSPDSVNKLRDAA